ncbi:hypothetical protein [Nostoc sp. T09]|nr:hypothetical protein [Nostoc sp. T09]
MLEPKVLLGGLFPEMRSPRYGQAWLLSSSLNVGDRKLTIHRCVIF